MTLLDLSIVNVALPSLRSEPRRGRQRPAVDRRRVRAGLRRASWSRPAGSATPAAGGRSSSSASPCSPCPAPPPEPHRTRPCWPSPGWCRGLAGGLIAPQTSGFIQNLFRGPERARAFGLFGAAIGITTAIGPLLGGLLVNLGGPDLGWRLVFYVNVPIGAGPDPAGATGSCRGGAPTRHRAVAGPGRGRCCSRPAMLLILLPLVEGRAGPAAGRPTVVAAGVRRVSPAGRLLPLGAVLERGAAGRR